MDAFDTYFRHPRADLLKRFHESKCSIVISTEINFIHQPQEWQRTFDVMSRQESRYLNSGLVLGYGHAMRGLLSVSANSSHLTISSKRGADQASLADALVHKGFDHFGACLDYDQSMFYTASGKRWSLRQSNDDIALYDPVVVHFSFTAAPRVNRTLHASYDGQNGAPWPEANLSFCRAQEKLCSVQQNGPFCHVGGGHRPGMSRLAC